MNIKKHKKVIKKEVYCPELNTNTIVVKTTRTVVGIKTMVRVIGFGAINIDPVKYEPLICLNPYVENVIEVLSRYKGKQNNSLISNDDLKVLKEYLLNILVYINEDSELTFYGVKSDHKYNLRFFNLDAFHNSMFENIPYKLERDRVLIYDLKNRLNPIINQLSKHFQSCSIIVKPNGTEIDINVVNGLDTNDILKDQNYFIDKDVIRYIKYNILNHLHGVIMDDRMLNLEQLKTEDEANDLTSEDYFTVMNATSSGKLRVYKRFKRVYRRNKQEELIAVIDYTYSVYDRSNKSITTDDLTKVINSFCDNNIHLVKEIK